MSARKPFRKRRLFPRTLDEVVKQATQPLMTKQGKLYSALLRDWAIIVGTSRAEVTRPLRLQFPATETAGATLHLQARPAAAPELAYVTEQMLEQCARYFGYRAITRIIFHPAHGVFTTPNRPTAPPTVAKKPRSSDATDDIDAILARIGTHLGSTIVKKE